MTQPAKKTDQRTAESDTFHKTAKVTELIGNSKKSFEDAVQSALQDARKSIRHIGGADVVKFSVKCEEGKVIEYRADLKIVFGIEDRTMRAFETAAVNGRTTPDEPILRHSSPWRSEKRRRTRVTAS